MVICQVCNSGEAKYKCCSCYKPFCSVDCCKVHKNSSEDLLKCIPSVKPKEEATEPVQDHAVLETATEDTVPYEELQKLGYNKKLQKLLQNRHLRDLIITVDQAPIASEAVRKAMLDPLFIEFANECLKVSEPESEN